MPKAKTARPARWRVLVAACLALVLAVGGAGIFYQSANAVASVVSIDVNPSIELRVNRDEKVLSCSPINGEARMVLEEMDGGKDLEGAKLTVAVNAIVGALVRHGYLDGLSNAILVSVEDRDQARAARMEEELRASISGVLEIQAPNTTVLSQTLTQDAGYDTYTDHHSEASPTISSGKAALVNQILTLGGNTDPNAFDKLAALTVEELCDLLETGETRMPIGRDAADWAAQEYAGTLILSSNVVRDVDPELDKRPAYYEVELVVGGKEYEYRVDAFTGAVLSGQANILGLTGIPAPAVSASPTPAAGLIGENAAWAAACTHAGCSLAELSYTLCELDYENGLPHHYEIEFCWNGNQYDYEIDSATGAVVKCEREVCDEEHHIHHVASGNVGPAVTPAPTATPAASQNLIGESAAWTYACAHAGCKVEDIQFNTCELDYEDGLPYCYELEFCWKGNQYDYDIDCATGAVLKHEWEVCDEAGHHHGGAAPSGTGTLVGEDAAWTAACDHVGCGMGDMSYATCELDREDGVYELEFCWQGNQYECEVNCFTGTLLQCESEVCHNGLHNCGGGGRHHGWGHH